MMYVIIAHTLEHVMAAMAVAAELGVGLILQSAPDAIFYAGSLYLWHMFETARKAYPQVNSAFILDCADAGSEAIAAMGTGHHYLRSSAPDEVREKLADIAGQYGVSVITEPYEALDLQQVADPEGACRQWLSAHGTVET